MFVCDSLGSTKTFLIIFLRFVSRFFFLLFVVFVLVLLCLFLLLCVFYLLV